MADLERYQRLFGWFRLSAEELYRRDDIDEQTEHLFRQLSTLAAADSTFNRQLPAQFIATLRDWRRRSPAAVRLFEDRDRRAFFLSDFLDYLELMHRAGD